MKKICALLLIAFLLSCSSKKNLVDQNSNQVTEIKSNKALFDSIEKNAFKKLNFQTLVIKSDLRYEDKNTTISLDADIRIKKDEIIWINIKMLGFPAAKAIVTPTRVSYYEKKNGTYFDGGFAVLKNIIGTELNFKQVQNMLLGNAVETLNEKEVLVTKKETIEIASKKNSDIAFTYQYNKMLELVSQNIAQPKQNRFATITYDGLQKIDQLILPAVLKITTSNDVQIKIDYKKIELNQALSYPYAIPSDYTAIKID